MPTEHENFSRMKKRSMEHKESARVDKGITKPIDESGIGDRKGGRSAPLSITARWHGVSPSAVWRLLWPLESEISFERWKLRYRQSTIRLERMGEEGMAEMQ